MHEVTADDDLFVLIKDGFDNNCYLNGLHMLYLALHCLDFYVWYARPIDALRHYDILSQDWKGLQDVIIDCIKDSLYWLTSDVLESPCTISTFYMTGGVSFLLVLHFWYWGMGVVHQDVHVSIL